MTSGKLPGYRRPQSEEHLTAIAKEIRLLLAGAKGSVLFPWEAALSDLLKLMSPVTVEQVVDLWKPLQGFGVKHLARRAVQPDDSDAYAAIRPLTSAFSKKLVNFKATFGLHCVWYNSCRVHLTLRCTPAPTLN